MRKNAIGAPPPLAGAHATHDMACGPEIRETWLHRREKTMRVSVDDLQDLTEYRTEEVATFAVGQFFLSGAVWLGIEKFFAGEAGSPAFAFCVLAASFGALLFAVGLRQVARTRRKLDRLLSEVEEEDVR